MTAPDLGCLFTGSWFIFISGAAMYDEKFGVSGICAAVGVTLLLIATGVIE